jgi:hypothetical protein
LATRSFVFPGSEQTLREVTAASQKPHFWDSVDLPYHVAAQQEDQRTASDLAHELAPNALLEHNDNDADASERPGKRQRKK